MPPLLQSPGDRLIAEMCRYIDAANAKPAGFDGKEHPEHKAMVKLLFDGPLYPLTADQLAIMLNK